MCHNFSLSFFVFLFYHISFCSATVKIKKEPPSALDRETLTVYNLFGEEPLHPDDMAAQSGLGPSKVLSALMRLELLGLIEQTDGRNYILK